MLSNIFTCLGYALPLLLALIIIPYKLLSDVRRKPKTIGFFHPYCNAGGGGERVLWAAIRTMQKRFSDYQFHVYSGDTDATKEQILLKARQRFGIELDPENIRFVYLNWRTVVEAHHYTRLTMLFQAIGGLVLALEAWYRLVPEVFIDSMGYPLSLPAFRIAGSKVVAYVHYPTISCDMLDVVESRQETFNNSSTIAQSNFLSWAKLLYYRLFACLYWLAGKAAHVVMVNGSWTQRHITSIWSRRDVSIVYPPCDVEAFLNIESVAETLLEETRTVRLLSVGQIRPEKNHKLQLEVLKGVKEPLKKKGYDVELCIAGGCRNEEDQKRVEELKREAEKMGIRDQLKWQLNVPYEDLVAELSKALISIHTMHNEHFGISVVEAMAASTIILSNDSGGPKMDIVKDFEGGCVGYLSVTKDEYVETILRIVEEGRRKRDEIRKVARKSLSRFGEAAFETLEMKLYCVHVLHKNDDNGVVRIFKSESDLSSFSFFQRGSVQEFMTFTSKLLVERSGLGARSSVKENEYLVHCYVRNDGLSAVCVTDAEYQQRVAMSFLGRVLDDFTTRVPAAQWPGIKSEKDCSYTGLKDLLDKWQNPREADPMTRVQEEVEETKMVMHSTIQSVLDRGEKLDDLVKKSENLSDQSKMFYTSARKMNKCCNYV